MKNTAYIKLDYYHRRELILDVAADLFAKNGYDAVTTLELAKAVGCSETSLLNMFHTKTAIYETLFEEWAYKYNKVITLRIINNSALETLKSFFNSYTVNRYSRNPEMRPRLETAVFSRQTNNWREKFYDVLKESPDFVANTIEPVIIFGQKNGEIKEGDSETLAGLFWAMTWGEIKLSHDFGKKHTPITFESIQYIFAK